MSTTTPTSAGPTTPTSAGGYVVAPDGHRYRDLNDNGVLDPYEDSRLSVAERIDDLMARLSTAEKVGLMFHTVIEAGADGEVLTGSGAIAKSGTEEVVVGKSINHFNVHALTDPRQAARWVNAVQRLAETRTAHGIPVTISTDPRHGAQTNAGASWSTPFFSSWPDPLGLAALGESDLVTRFADTVRREYRAIGLRAALHPVGDLATEPRWCRQSETFGSDAATAARLTTAYLQGLQGDALGPDSVSGCTKHFPGGGPQADGEDAHFPYGRDQVYPGGRFADHLEPFRAAIAAGTSVMMPYYGRPVDLVVDGVAVEPVGFGFNRWVLTELLRDQLGYDGVILSDWELINDNHVGDQVLPARAWGVEELSPPERLERLLLAGIDQFGGEECVELLLGLIEHGRVQLRRIDDSARRLLRVKFALGLFDDPYVDEDVAASLPLADDVAAGELAQARSVVVLADRGELPLRAGRRIYAEGIDPAEVARLGEPVDDPSRADLALVRLTAPFDRRDDLFLEAMFRQGSLEFPPGLPVRLRRIAEQCPLVIDVHLDRPAVLTPLLDLATVLTVGFGVGDRAWLDALTHRVPPQGRLPFELPRSMAAVRDSRSDVGDDTVDPIFPRGFGLGG